MIITYLPSFWKKQNQVRDTRLLTTQRLCDCTFRFVLHLFDLYLGSDYCIVGIIKTVQLHVRQQQNTSKYKRLPYDIFIVLVHFTQLSRKAAAAVDDNELQLARADKQQLWLTSGGLKTNPPKTQKGHNTTFKFRWMTATETFQATGDGVAWQVTSGVLEECRPWLNKTWTSRM